MNRKLFIHAVILIVAATMLEVESGRAATQAESGNPLFTAEDTILLEQTDGHVVASMTDLLEWRGALVIVDRRELNLKTYDLDTGERLAVWGRSGQGPREFRSIEGAVVLHDGGLAVLDALLARVTIFDAPGEVRTSWSVPGHFGAGIDVLPGGDLLMPGRIIANRRTISDSAVHRFDAEGEMIRSYLTRPEATRFPEGSINAMKAIVVDSTIIGLQHTTNVAVTYDLRTEVERPETLGSGFYQPIEWSLEPPVVQDGVVETWLKDQMIGWWLRDLNDEVYTAGFRIWMDSIDEWRIRWVFATPGSGPFAESELTDAHPAFIRDGRLHSVRIRPDGRAELIIGQAPAVQ